MSDLFTDSDAVFSGCRQYRYQLSRVWGGGPRCAFVMLNPSTADESANDPTSRRCIRFAKDWGYDGLYQVNLFALRGSDPSVLLRHSEPVGHLTDEWLRATARSSDLVVAAWGAHKAVAARERAVTDLLQDIRPLRALRVTKGGHPSHPLYLPATLKPKEFAP